MSTLAPLTPALSDDVLLTLKEAMNYLRVSRSTLYRLIGSGQLTGHKVGSTWRFYRTDLQACISQQMVAQTEEDGSHA